MKNPVSAIIWLIVALLGAWAYVTLALHRGESISSGYILLAAVCTYVIGYRFYSKWIAVRVLMLNERRATPCVAHDDGKDFCKTNKWIVFGHHFAAISGPGPLVGPVLAAQFGYLPGTLWILIGVVLGGAVQDFVILFCSMRRNGKSLGQMVKEELNTTAGFIALVAILAILVILLAVLGLVVVRALAESPWGVFTVGATIPIAMFMGSYMRFWRVGKVLEASAIGFVLLLLGVWGGKLIYENAEWSKHFSLRDITLAWTIIIYGIAASILPVWLLLAPRDYLSTFMKLGTIFALVVGIFLTLPHLQMPALTQFVDGTGPVVPGKVFPFCFITIACGAISGFHTLIASGTTPKLITRESYARPIGYGAMCLESLVAIMAIIAACTMDPGVYFGMNMKGEAAVTVAKINAYGFHVTPEHMDALAKEVGENTLFGRTGGAATLAVGMAQIFGKFTKDRWLDLWYHFAVMFEALFILTTIDAGTRVGRYILQDFLGHIWKPLGDTHKLAPNLFASGLIVGAWGIFLIQGVRDPLGGINSLWPLFGIANQMLAAIALCLASTILLKMQLWPEGIGDGREAKTRKPAFALLTLIPLVWLLAVTFTAGVEKIWHPDSRIGFVGTVNALTEKMPALQSALDAARVAGDVAVIETARKAMYTNRAQHFNNILDIAVTASFLILVFIIVIISVREWILLLSRRKSSQTHESEPVWLPDYAVAEGKPLRVAGTAALALTLVKELSGESRMERARQQATIACECSHHENVAAKTDKQIYDEVTKERFTGVRRCC